MRSAMCAPEIGSSIPQTNRERHVGASRAPGPALLVPLAVLEVADQAVEMRWPSSWLIDRPDVGAVGGRVEASANVGRKARHEQLLGDERADLGALLGVEEGGLDRLRAVNVRIEAAVQQVDRASKVDGQRAIGAAREQLLCHRHRVVVGDQRPWRRRHREPRAPRRGRPARAASSRGPSACRTRRSQGSRASEARGAPPAPERPSPSRARSWESRATASSAGPRPCGGRRVAGRHPPSATRSPSDHQSWIALMPRAPT